jgi:lipooligosaccharide transport system permease protein
MAIPATSVLGYHLVGYRRTWRSSVFSTFLMPLIFLSAIGLGVGGYVNGSGRLGVDYLSYLAPGVLASTALNVAVGESTFRIYAQLEWDRMYEAMLATPLTVFDLLVGQFAYIAFRLLISVVVFLGAMLAFGTLHSPLAPLVIPVALLLGLASATPTVAFTGTQHSDSGFGLYFRLAVVPVSLFSGVFVPVAQLPAVIRPLAWLSPLWHGVELCRGLTLGHLSLWPSLGHAAYLLLWLLGGFLLSYRIFSRRLVS